MLARDGDEAATCAEQVRDLARGQDTQGTVARVQATSDMALGRGLEARLVKSLIAHGVTTVASLSRVAFALRGAFDDLEITRDVAYGSDPAQRFDVWCPRARAAAPRPLVLLLHGGGFQHLDRDSHWAFAARFAHAGAVVINADYRLAPAYAYPAAARDAARVHAHALTHARALGADPDQLIVAGASAGANLALGIAIAATAAGRPPRACVLFSGLLQVSDIARLYRAQRVSRLRRARMASIACDYIGTDAAWHVPAVADPWLDPLLHLERTTALPAAFPAVFSSSGTRDQVLGDAQRLHACLTRHHHVTQLDVVDRAGHAFQGLVFQQRVRAVWARCFAFLHDVGVPLSAT